MTECENADMRDLLPDFVAGTLSGADVARLQAHVDTCGPCADEIALLRVARAVRPSGVVIDVARIVAALPRSTAMHAPILTLPSSNAAAVRRPNRGSWQLWKAAAAIGVLAVGGWSVMMARSGGLASMNAPQADSAHLVDVAERPVAPSGIVAVSSTPVVAANTTATAVSAPRAASVAPANVAVSVGDLSDYTDAELERMLARLEKWDGATSVEPTTQVPIVSVPRSGSER